MNRWLSRRIGLFFIAIAVAGCVDYQEPTGPVPTPDPQEGELTSVVVRADGSASGAGGRASRAPNSASAARP